MSDLRQILQEIHDKHGRLTPEVVVQEATDPSHPLHSRFTWDNEAAGEAWRREQAHRLIQKVKVVYREADERNPAKSIRAFHAVRTDQGHVYKPVDEVVDDDFTRRLVLADMQREWKALHRRYRDFEEFLSMVRADLEPGAA